MRTFSIVLLQAASHIQFLHAVNLPIHHSPRLSRECATDDKDEDYLAEPGDDGLIFYSIKIMKMTIHNLKFTSSWDSFVKQSPSISLSAFQLSGELDLNIRFYEKEGSKLLTMVYSFKFIASYRIYHPKLPSIKIRQKIETNSFRFIAVRYPLQAKHLCTQSRFDLLIKMEIWMDENEDSFPCYDVRSNLFGIVEMKSC